MSVRTTNLMGYIFDGPHNLNASFNEVSGVYLIVKNDGTIVDVGETERLGERIPGHERKNCWSRNNGIFLWFHGDTSQSSRLKKEKVLRDNFNPVCGIE